MPPRKKAAADGTTPAPTRSSTRIKASSKDAAVPAKPASKAKTKRALSPEDKDDEDDAPPAKKPTSKKAKKTKPDDDDEAVTKDDKPEKIVTVRSSQHCSLFTALKVLPGVEKGCSSC